MTDLEQKCNEYREYKRLAEQAEQMRDSLRNGIMCKIWLYLPILLQNMRHRVVTGRIRQADACKTNLHNHVITSLIPR